jgi:hypothetical protein
MKNNKMVKWVAVIIAVGIIPLASALRAQTVPAVPQGQGYEDAETLAQAFLLHDTDHYTASLYAYGPGGNGPVVSMDMILNKDLFITNMVINGTNIPLPKPLGGIPIPASGFQDVNIQITAVDKYGATAAQSPRYYTNYLAQGTPLSFSMTPQFPPSAIQIQKGLDPGSIVVNVTGVNGGWGWSYDPSTGLLTIQVYDPSSTDIAYTVTDSSGGLLAHDFLPFFQQLPGAGTATNSVFNLHNDGNVVLLSLNANGYANINNTPFDSPVQRNNQYIMGKVVGVTDVGNQKLYIYAGNLYSGTIEVRKWSATGTMDIIPCSTTFDSYGGVTAITSNYVDRVVVTVLPGKDTAKTVYLYFGRSY